MFECENEKQYSSFVLKKENKLQNAKQNPNQGVLT